MATTLPKIAAADGGPIAWKGYVAQEAYMVTSVQFRRMITVAFIAGLAAAPLINAMLP